MFTSKASVVYVIHFSFLPLRPRHPQIVFRPILNPFVMLFNSQMSYPIAFLKFAPTTFVPCCPPVILNCIPSFLPHVPHMSVTTPKLFLGYYLAHSFLRHPLQVALSSLKISNALCHLPLWHCFFSISSTTISPHAIPCFLVVKCPPTHVSYYCIHTPHNKYSYPQYILFSSLREKIELTIRPPHSSILHSPHHLIIE